MLSRGWRGPHCPSHPDGDPMEPTGSTSLPVLGIRTKFSVPAGLFERWRWMQGTAKPGNFIHFWDGGSFQEHLWKASSNHLLDDLA